MSQRTQPKDEDTGGDSFASSCVTIVEVFRRVDRKLSKPQAHNISKSEILVRTELVSDIGRCHFDLVSCFELGLSLYRPFDFARNMLCGLCARYLRIVSGFAGPTPKMRFCAQTT
jgi:hypothetical protein